MIEIKNNNSLNIGFAGSECLMKVLNLLVYNLKKQDINYANINFVNLIEFDVSVRANELTPFNNYMSNEFYKRLNINKDHLYEIEIKDNNKINKFLNKNILDLAIIEIGVDGQICFHNAKSLVDFNNINKVELNESTREEYAYLFDNDKSKVSLYGYGVSFKNILNAKKIIVIADGSGKINGATKLLDNEVDKNFVATHLIKNKNVVLYADLLALKTANK